MDWKDEYDERYHTPTERMLRAYRIDKWTGKSEETEELKRQTGKKDKTGYLGRLHGKDKHTQQTSR